MSAVATPERAILWNCNEGHIERVAELLRLDGGLVNARDADGYTPLHRASYTNNVPLVKLLLAYGANPNAVTEFGWTPVHSACQWTNAECVAVLLQHGADVNARTDGGTAASSQPATRTAIKLIAALAPQIKRRCTLPPPFPTVARPH